jgi:lipopolysaccharide transport system permease protein
VEPRVGAADRIIRVAPSRRHLLLTVRDLQELWAYRELLSFLVWRDIKVRYKQTALGALWAILQPLIAMVVFTLLFHQALHVPSDNGVPYPLFSFTALLPWMYFASCLSQSSTSIVGNQGLITKVYFPRLLIPLASVVAPVIDFLLAFTVLIGMFFIYGRLPHWHAITLPFFLGMALVTAFGVGLWLSALNVRYRDVPYALPFLTQVWFFVTPVLWGIATVSGSAQSLLALNPMTGVVEGFRWGVLGSGLPRYGIYFTSLAVALVILLSGLWYFKRVERYFADLI